MPPAGIATFFVHWSSQAGLATCKGGPRSFKERKHHTDTQRWSSALRGCSQPHGPAQLLPLPGKWDSLGPDQVKAAGLESYVPQHGHVHLLEGTGLRDCTRLPRDHAKSLELTWSWVREMLVSLTIRKQSLKTCRHCHPNLWHLFWTNRSQLRGSQTHA